ncbi:NADH-ubiquinone oxidoreductase [Marinobacter panjinensis]|uniref:NADH-ubiquinone oxidoreductase n=1 Tax=Marinobacter panjinensis TaxID=2576384 RepID=A0A4U6R3W9_9GAMM|nr:complex I subunit 5 family protein [Marinobacter panjinensis]MCR8913137.1 complex I subunit 5 family protein [Marinobacter panjinensis]TKV68173.1 NADH-ubiquinone oxidoreductase [Marinobacter panjinensis]
MMLPGSVLVLVAVCLPLLYPAMALHAGWVRAMRYVLPVLPLPALLLALGSEPGWQLEMPWLLNGGLWAMDELRRLFLLLTAVLWLVAGIYAVGYLTSHHLRRFCVFWGLTLAGNLGLTVAVDIGSFYSFFALMTFAGYGLVVHEGTNEAIRAGRVYLVMAVLGEMAILMGLLLASAAAGSQMLADLPEGIAASPRRDLIMALLIAGFGVKAGLPLLHFWLPLAHPVAPTPASAVLSGAMIKAGLLGWLVTLPFGEAALPGWGALMIVAGAVGAIGAAVVGVCQQRPKAVLAYSSISQMGLMVLMVGVALADSGRAPVLFPVIALYALHHGLAKGSLFLSAGMSLPAGAIPRAGAWILIALPGLSLAGLPFTSGALAKLAMKEGLLENRLELALASYLSPLMAAGVVATLLLVLRYLWILAGKLEIGDNPPMLVAGWLTAIGVSLVAFWWMPWDVGGLVESPVWLPAPYQLWALLWPMLIASGLALLTVLASWLVKQR